MTGIVEPCRALREFLANRRPGVDVESFVGGPDADAQLRANHPR